MTQYGAGFAGSGTVHALNSDIVTDSQSTENISLFHAYARKNNMWILDHSERSVSELRLSKIVDLRPSDLPI